MKIKSLFVSLLALLFAALCPAQMVQRNFNGIGYMFANNPGVTEIGFSLSFQKPITNTGATYTVTDSDVFLIANIAGTQTLTLPTPTLANAGRAITVRTITANTVVSAGSNVVPLVGGAAGTAILAGTAGKWARLVSDGTAWQIMEGN